MQKGVMHASDNGGTGQRPKVVEPTTSDTQVPPATDRGVQLTLGFTKQRPSVGDPSRSKATGESIVGKNKNAHIHPDPARIESNHFQGELADCRIALGETTQQLAEAKRSVAKLSQSLGEAQLSTLQTERQIEQLKATVLTKEVEVKTAKGDAAAAERLAYETPSGNAEVRAKAAEFAARRDAARLAQLDAKYAAALTDLEKAETAKRALAQKERTLTYEKQELERRVKDLEGEIVKLHRNADTSKTRIDELDRVAKNAVSDRHQATRLVEDSAKALADVREEVDRLEEELKDKTVHLAEGLIHQCLLKYDDFLKMLQDFTPFSGQIVGNIPMVAGEDYVVMIGSAGLSVVCVDSRKLLEELGQVDKKTRQSEDYVVMTEKHNGKAEPVDTTAPPELVKTVGLTEQLKALLAERPMTAKELMKATGYSAPSVRKYLRILGANSSESKSLSGHGWDFTYSLPALN
jgi:Bacterial regulatory protein, arsR family